MSILAASLMCADLLRLGEEIEELESAGIDMFHLDLMDGHFVPNFALGFETVRRIGDKATKPVDAHLMVENPDRYIDRLAAAGVSIMYVHPEADPDVASTLRHISQAGARAGICFNPATPPARVQPLLPWCDYVMVMAVHPGFAGQKVVPAVDEKIAVMAEWKERFGYTLMVDGGCSPERIAMLQAMNVDGFVLGLSALFGQNIPYAHTIAQLQHR
ncbi:MAG: ribulose-phosphate 3-epimerase [Planctomycetes bacterium]|nr:ribulose-phosphate 3-epimerase [Planctomycetota bacterium]